MVMMRRLMAATLTVSLFASSVLGFGLLQDKPAVTTPDSSTELSQPEFEAGQKLADAFNDRSSIALGTIVNVGPQVKEKNADEQNAASFRKVRVAVDEWLWQSPKEKPAEIELQQVTPPVRQKFNSGPWTAWNGVDVVAGNKVLIGLYPDKSANRVYRGKSIETSFVISNPALLQSLRQAISWHKRYVENPDELLGVAGSLNSGSDSVLLGYLLNFLWRGGTFGNRDVEALALARLLEGNGLADVPSRLVRLSLTRLMSSQQRPVSDSTRRSLTESLVVIGSGDNQRRAAEAIRVILQLIDDSQLVIAPFLTPERQRKLAQNYLSLVKTKQIGQRNAKFESQMKIGI